jgi:hypothetical protein
MGTQSLHLRQKLVVQVPNPEVCNLFSSIITCKGNQSLKNEKGRCAASNAAVQSSEATTIQMCPLHMLNIVRCHHYIAYQTVYISPSSQPHRALSTLNYGLTPNCNLSQLHHGHTSIACAHTTGNSNTYLSQVSYRNLLRSHYKQRCNQCEHS